jgi:transposase-like protein
MGRKSSLTPEQWIEVERRHLVDGDSFNKLATDFGVNESSIRRRLKQAKDAPDGKNKLQALAEEKVRADAQSKRISEQIAQLPFAGQAIVSDLARKMANISHHLGSAAEYSAASAHRLSMLANQQMDRVDDVDPMKSTAHLAAHAALQKMANSAMEGPMNLLRANKQEIEPTENVFDAVLAAVNGSSLKVVANE